MVKDKDITAELPEIEQEIQLQVAESQAYRNTCSDNGPEGYGPCVVPWLILPVSRTPTGISIHCGKCLSNKHFEAEKLRPWSDILLFAFKPLTGVTKVMVKN